MGCCSTNKKTKDPQQSRDSSTKRGENPQNMGIPAESESKPMEGQSNGKGGILQAKQEYSWNTRKKLNPADFVFREMNNQTLSKKAGDINGEQFNLESCSNCKIYLQDHTAQVFVDECQDCDIFIGPCASSIFVRDCKNCKIILSCQQLRVRDCTDIHFLIFSIAGPVIEKSTNLQFGCFDYSYPELEDDLKKAELNIWNNAWSEIYDFTDSSLEKHFSYLPLTTTYKDLIQSLSLAEVHDVSFNQPSSNSQELSSNDDKDSVFELVISDDQPPTSAAIPKIAGRMNTPTLKEEYNFLRYTRQFVINKTEANQMFSRYQNARDQLLKSTIDKDIICWEIGVLDSNTATGVKDLIEKELESYKTGFYLSEGDIAKFQADLVFEKWKDRGNPIK